MTKIAELVKSKTGTLVLKNVRISYPSLFKKGMYKGQETKYQANFLIPKSNTKVKEALDKEIAAILSDKKISLARIEDKYKCINDGDKRFVKDSDDIDPITKDHWILKAKSDRRPEVRNKDMSPLTPDDQTQILGGYYVDVVFNIYFSNKTVPTLGANLHAVRLNSEAEVFGGTTPVDVNSVFDEVGIDEEDLGL